AAGLRAYQEFAARLASEYGGQPAAETQALERLLLAAPSAEQIGAMVTAGEGKPRLHVPEPRGAPIRKAPRERAAPAAAALTIVALSVAAWSLAGSRGDAAPTPETA